MAATQLTATSAPFNRDLGPHVAPPSRYFEQPSTPLAYSPQKGGTRPKIYMFWSQKPPGVAVLHILPKEKTVIQNNQTNM